MSTRGNAEDGCGHLQDGGTPDRSLPLYIPGKLSDPRSRVEDFRTEISVAE